MSQPAAFDAKAATDRIRRLIPSPVIVRSVELLRWGSTGLVRSRSADGATGIAVTTGRIRYLHPLLMQRVAPLAVGQDARDLERVVDRLYRERSNYKLVGLPFWSCVAWVELSLVDLLGRTASRPASDLFGGRVREHVPVYLSLLGRDLEPAHVVDRLARSLAETGARAVKVKIGGRMSLNADASPGRTDALIPLLRRELGDDIAIYVDANGSYDADRAIEVARMLRAHGVGFFEEPCPFEAYEETRRVRAAGVLPVAGGEQETSLYRWKELLASSVVDIPQPDTVYIGGFTRARTLAGIAAERGLKLSMHNPHRGPAAAYMLHLVSTMHETFGTHEWNAEHRNASWHQPPLEVRDGMAAVPSGPGLGVRVDPAALRRAAVIGRVGRLARTVFGFARGALLPAKTGGTQ